MMPTLEVTNPVDALDDEAFRQHVGAVLTRELSLKGYLRFLRLYGPHRGNYTEDRHEWLDGLTVQDILDGPK